MTNVRTECQRCGGSGEEPLVQTGEWMAARRRLLGLPLKRVALDLNKSITCIAMFEQGERRLSQPWHKEYDNYLKKHEESSRFHLMEATEQ